MAVSRVLPSKLVSLPIGFLLFHRVRAFTQTSVPRLPSTPKAHHTVALDPAFSHGRPVGTSGVQVSSYHAALPDYDQRSRTYYAGARLDEHQDLVLFSGLRKPMKALDVACGPAPIGCLAAEVVGHENVWCIDSAPDMLGEAWKYVPLDFHSTGFN